MSKSYKRFPKLKQEKEDYHYLNRQLRRDKLAELPKGGSYRRHRPHWNTWAYRWTWEDAKNSYYKRKYLQENYTLDEWYQCWARLVKRK